MWVCVIVHVGGNKGISGEDNCLIHGEPGTALYKVSIADLV